MQPQWNGTFVLLEKRELKDKTGEIFKRLFKLGFMGGAIECTIEDSGMFNAWAAGTTVTATGTFGQDYRGNLAMNLASLEKGKA